MALDFQDMFRRELEREMKEQAQSAAASLDGTHNGPEGSSKEPLAKGKSLDLEKHRLAVELDSVCYVRGFLSPPEQAYLVKQISAKEDESLWARLSKRRMRNLGGIPHPNGMIAERFPRWMELLAQKLRDAGVFKASSSALRSSPNQVLLNRYRPGEGIDAHRDGPLFKPYVAIISLGSSAIMDFIRPDATGMKCENVCRVYLESGSLLIFSGEAYTDVKHAIFGVGDNRITEDVANRAQCGLQVGQTVPSSDAWHGERFSLTVRDVEHVSIYADDVLTASELREKERRKQWWLDSINEKSL